MCINKTNLQQGLHHYQGLHHHGLHHIIKVIKGSPPSPSMHKSLRDNRDYHHQGCIVLWPLQGSHIIIIRYKASNICCWHQGQYTIWYWHQWQSTVNNLPLCHWWQQLMLPLRACSHLNLSPPLASMEKGDLNCISSRHLYKQLPL